MANRVKEDEKNERIIRGLLKLPENRRCINCNSLGPQYVCTSFWTFVCTTCSGIHREFTHRVKSVSMAKFTSQEVSALQAGGNQRAKEIYFKEWDPQRQSIPDSSNVDRLRDFIKHVYVDRRYTGEPSIDKSRRVKSGEREDSYENRRVDTNRGGSRSPPYEDVYERRYGERPSPVGRNDERNYRYNYDERRSPGFDQEGQRYGDYRRSPVRFEVVDDRRRDDRFGNRRFEERRFPDVEARLEGRSSNRQKGLDVSSPPIVRPVREILGEDVPPLRVGETPKANGNRTADGSLHPQRTASSSSLASVDGNSVELKRANSGSLIDFNADLVPLDVAVAVSPTQAQSTTSPTSQTVTQPPLISSTDDNWASFDFATQEKVSQPPSNVDTLESVFSQLSAPAAPPLGNIPTLPSSGAGPKTVPVGNMFPVSAGNPVASLGQTTTSPSGGSPAAVSVDDLSMLSVSGSAPTAAPGGMTSMFTPIGGQWPGMQQHQPSLFTANDSQSTVQQLVRSVSEVSNNQPWSSSLVRTSTLPNMPSVQSNAPVPLTGAHTLQPSQAPSTQDTSSVVTSQPSHVETKSSGRKELPEDLFTTTYSSVPAPVSGWQTAPPRGMAYGMQYPTAMSVSTFPHLLKSTNPFDLNDDTSVVQAPRPMFPSMSSLQGALPHMAPPSGLLRTTSLGSLGTPPRWVPPQSQSYAAATLPNIKELEDLAVMELVLVP
ncbi:PREDICTED: probable ADP-ribosylation factor GTPase-activating protein AGD14 isoform X2 [Nelumbo nucifera]|uniref:Probable ADP-ribosylation factor GTPase-activating protein AGD14 isoform X2 n=1 Tax=Nelumbo nucifera TaxID=4432 RepID=A0A1U8Q0P9_NELNU|nr:PREDICTED: probable ADP-ribosylation factor GTPase-activating protein AGD14 isoform X2 [Nelumbo nucifera]